VGHEPQEVRFVIATRHLNNLLLHGQRRDDSGSPAMMPGHMSYQEVNREHPP